MGAPYYVFFWTRLESFYHGQDTAYDVFRQRLLHGRRSLWDALPIPDGGVWGGDMGGGTAANLEYLGAAIQRLSKVYVVDLCPTLLQMAHRRSAEHGWTNVRTVEADAAHFVPCEAAVDVMTFSYSLTMMLDWFAAIDHAWRLLRPDGTIGVVDFYVSCKHPEETHIRHPWYTRTFWPIWFGFDKVFPSPDHMPYLHHRFERQYCSEQRANMPYLPGVRVPYYVFIGRRPLDPVARLPYAAGCQPDYLPTIATAIELFGTAWGHTEQMDVGTVPKHRPEDASGGRVQRRDKGVFPL